MTARRTDPVLELSPVKAKLAAFGPLRETDLELIDRGAGDVRVHAPGDEVIVRDPGAVRLVTSGWVGLVRLLFDGRRQVLQLALAGDLIHAPVSRGDHVMALTSARSVDASGVRRAAEKEQGSALQRAWRLAEHDAHCELLAQIARLGAMSAHERTANWIAELMRRHARAGLRDGRWMPWPVTQEIVADVLGLSIVHVNRVLQQLRRDGLIQLRAGMLHVPEPELLAGAGLVESA